MKNKWTWEKILKCDEIKRGVRVESVVLGYLAHIVVAKNKSVMSLLNVATLNESKHFTSIDDFSRLQFFHTTGEEILPPKERETITLYETILDFGDVRMCDENGFFS